MANEDFYAMPDSGTKQVDLLFLIASAPVATTAMPETGSGSYVGLALAMELAMDELVDKFPTFFPAESGSPRECSM